nr:hypothetical protein [Tanacetum cinerariifolium]
MEYVRGHRRNKCFWTEEETIVLIQVLQDIARDPSWTTPGGFKSNYMCEVHRRMVSKMPTFTKQPSPHIESRVKWLKTKFFVINDMVKHIGCQWNKVEKKIICEREWYESYCQTHREAKGLWDFRFPFYDQLALVYRRGLAPNAAVEARGDYVNNMEVVLLESKMESGSEDLVAKLALKPSTKAWKLVLISSKRAPISSGDGVVLLLFATPSSISGDALRFVATGVSFASLFKAVGDGCETTWTLFSSSPL